MTVTRGTTNGNDRGNNADRLRRREWVVDTYRADVDAGVSVLGGIVGEWDDDLPSRCAFGVIRMAACRCYRCGILLTVDTVTIDRIWPGCLGGTYAKNNIRPACERCNTETGAALANTKAIRVAKMRASALKRTCPWCGAVPKHPCVGGDGRRLSRIHAVRRPQ